MQIVEQMPKAASAYSKQEQHQQQQWNFIISLLNKNRKK